LLEQSAPENWKWLSPLGAGKSAGQRNPLFLIFFDTKETYFFRTCGLEALQIELERSDTFQPFHDDPNYHKYRQRFTTDETFKPVAKYNNDILKQNFLIKIAKFILKTLQPIISQKRSLFEDKSGQIQSSFLHILGIPASQIHRTIFPSEFSNILIQTFQLDLTNDEISLLHF
jgi:hypothetical protein